VRFLSSVFSFSRLHSGDSPHRRGMHMKFRGFQSCSNTRNFFYPNRKKFGVVLVLDYRSVGSQTLLHFQSALICPATALLRCTEDAGLPLHLPRSLNSWALSRHYLSELFVFETLRVYGLNTFNCPLRFSIWVRLGRCIYRTNV
jgi:hypothetical protein